MYREKNPRLPVSSPRAPYSPTQHDGVIIDVAQLATESPRPDGAKIEQRPPCQDGDPAIVVGDVDQHHHRRENCRSIGSLRDGCNSRSKGTDGELE